MTKKSLILALILTTAAGLSASAAPKKKAPRSCEATQTEQCTAQAAACSSGQRFCAGARSPFDGIEVTAEQQGRLDSISQNYTRCKKQRRPYCNNCAPAPATCNDCATTNCAPDSACTTCTPRLTKKQIRSNYLSKVKEILTPEQYVKFLENIVVARPSHKHIFDQPKGPRLRDPATGRLLPAEREGMRLQRPRPTTSDSTEGTTK